MIAKTFTGLILMAALATAAAAQGTQIVTEEMVVKSPDPGIELYVRNKRLADMSAFTPERTVVFVHGSLYPGHTAYDIRLGGTSWMDYIASRGYDVYVFDMRGYGRSTRPKEMSERPDANPPIVRTPTAAMDVSTIVDFVLKRRNIPRLNLLSWSWGTTVAATYATQNADKVQRLVLSAPQWIRPSTMPMAPATAPLGAYSLLTREQAKARWLVGVPAHKLADLIPAGWFEQWADANWATDPIGAQRTPPVLRIPSGNVQDAMEYWAHGKPMYDPAKLSMPTLIVVAEWDRATPPVMAQALFPLLVNSPRKRLVVLGEGTHTMMWEKNRFELFKTVQTFLDDGLD